MNDSKSVVFGLTGGIASGKSTVAKRYRELGVFVVDADEISKKVTAPGSRGASEVADAFRRWHIIFPDGSLDRKKIGDIVFRDFATRRILETIVQPLIAEESARQVDEALSQGELLVCYEAALIVELGLQDKFRPLVVVSASPSFQVSSLMARNNLTEDEARIRMESQLPHSYKITVADYVIENRSSIPSLIEHADAVLEAICKNAGINPGAYGLSARP